MPPCFLDEAEHRTKFGVGTLQIVMITMLGPTIFFSLYPVAHQKKAHHQHVLIFSLHKQDTGQLSGWNDFYWQSICIGFKQLSWECNDKDHSHRLEGQAKSGQRVTRNELVQWVGMESLSCNDAISGIKHLLRIACDVPLYRMQCPIKNQGGRSLQCSWRSTYKKTAQAI